MQLEISQIKLDGGTQPRVNRLQSVIDDYIEAMENGAMFPPVDVFYDGSSYWLVDGFHRIQAAKYAGFGTIETNIHQGTLLEAQWFSYGVNKTHGLRRTNDDKRMAVEAALKHPNASGMSDRELADHVGVSHMTINNYRNEMKSTVKNLQSNERTGRDGRTINTANIGKLKPPEPSSKLTRDNGDTHEEIPVSTPVIELAIITEPASVGETRLIQMADKLVTDLSFDDLQRLIELLAERIAVDM